MLAEFGEYGRYWSWSYRVIGDGEAPLVTSVNTASTGKMDRVVNLVKEDI